MAEDNSTNNAEVFIYTAGVVVPDDVVRVRVEGVTLIPMHAFSECKKLEVVELCHGLLDIGFCAFERCTSLRKVTLPSTVTVIRSNAFENCVKLEEVKLHEGILEIGDQAFQGCKLLKRINMPSTVTAIKQCTFQFCEGLKEVELNDGLQEIGFDAFYGCSSLKSINIPSTLKNIGNWAFCCSPVCVPILPDGIESIGSNVFCHNRFPTFRFPPLITTIQQSVLYACKGMFSLELSESVQQIKFSPFEDCRSLRNLALPSILEVTCSRDDSSESYGPFRDCLNLQQLFKTERQLINALRHRFDNLPIHKMIYYQSYNNMTVDQLNNALDVRSGQRRSSRMKLDQTGNKQDCLGMTPLHILACSSIQNIELYKALVEKYPENLIQEDRWGAVPLLYAVWGNSSEEIVKFLVDSYKSLHPNYEFDWTKMVVTLGLSTAPTNAVQRLLNAYGKLSGQAIIDWDQVIDELTKPAPWQDESDITHAAKTETLQFLIRTNLSTRLDSIGVKQWRDDIISVIGNFKYTTPLNRIEKKLSHYEDECHKLKEAIAMLELALWKNKINAVRVRLVSRCNKKPRNELNAREQCRISSGADVVIEHVLPFLVPNDSDDN